MKILTLLYFYDWPDPILCMPSQQEVYPVFAPLLGNVNDNLAAMQQVGTLHRGLDHVQIQHSNLRADYLNQTDSFRAHLHGLETRVSRLESRVQSAEESLQRTSAGEPHLGPRNWREHVISFLGGVVLALLLTRSGGRSQQEKMPPASVNWVNLADQ